MSQESIQELIFKAHECIENSDLTEAMEVGKKILAIDSDNTQGLEIMGYVMLELNCLEEAKFCFSKSIENKSNESHVPYLYLGQLAEKEQSEKYFLDAIVMMLKNLGNSEEKKVLFRPTKLDVSNAYVSLCELYMTDLCDKEDAEKKCNDYIQKAIEYDETNPAAWQSIASLNLVKCETEKSKENIKKSLDLWLPAAMKIVSDAESEETTNEILATCDLSADLRIKTAEILFELEMLSEVRSVLETILTEDEEHFQAHYLMALALEGVLATANEDDKEDLVERIEDHAGMAIDLADKEVEMDAITQMMGLLEKIGVDHNGEHAECGSSCESESDDDDASMEVEKQ